MADDAYESVAASKFYPACTVAAYASGKSGLLGFGKEVFQGCTGGGAVRGSIFRVSAIIIDDNPLIVKDKFKLFACLFKNLLILYTSIKNT